MVGKRTTKIRQGLPPSPFSGNARKKTYFLQEMVPYMHKFIHSYWDLNQYYF